MDEEPDQYTQELEKLMNSEVVATFWAPTMDILVITTYDNLIEGYRISFRAPRFFQIEESHAVQTLCFSPNCKNKITQPSISVIAWWMGPRK